MFVYYNTATDQIGLTEPNRYTQFECLNELKDILSRSYDNLIKMNRFVFECDTVNKELQKERAINLVNQHIACRAVDSGNKSIHVIIELDEDITDVNYYKQIWHFLNKRYFNSEADTACSNPNRLTRCPNSIRLSNNKVQEVIASNDAKYTLDKTDKATIKSELDRQKMLAYLRDSSVSRSVTDHDGMCKNWEIITRYINTPFPKMTGNVNSSKWLYAAIKTCQKYKDNQTLQAIINKAKSEHWSDKELDRILK